jgi:hypothetical protein
MASANPFLEEDVGDISNEEACFCGMLGQVAFCLLGVVAFVGMLSWLPTAGVTDVPTYARSIMYYSLGYHFDDVQAHLNSISPPPPSF